MITAPSLAPLKLHCSMTRHIPGFESTLPIWDIRLKEFFEDHACKVASSVVLFRAWPFSLH